MFLRSGRVKKVLFPSPSTPFSTPTGVLSAPLSICEQKEAAERRRREREMAESIDALDQCCQAAKAKVSRIRKAILDAKQDHKKFAYNALKLYAKQVDAAYDEYNSFTNRIYLVDPKKKQEFEPKFIEFEELYEFVRIALSEMMQQYEDAEKAAAEVAAFEREKQLLALKFRNDTVAVTNVPANPVPYQIPPSLLLQQTPLPTFDGRYDQWHKFKARFCDIVDRCTTDSPATKLHYLDKALVGDAQGVIDEQTLNDNNYEGAWRILIERYENIPMVVHGHVTKLLNLKPMARESSLELRRLLDDCTKRVESLEFHKLKMDKMAEAIVITLLTSKLDPSTRRSWEASCDYGKLPVFKDTVAFLRKHSHVLERCEQSSTVTKPKVAALRTQTPTVTSKAHSVTVSKTNEGCAVCGATHSVEACGAFKKLIVEERYSKAKQFGLCFLCLNRGHRTNTCKKTDLCTACKKKHHALLHPDEKKLDTPEAGRRSAEEQETSSSCPKPPLTAAKCSIPNERTKSLQTKQVLLATAVVLAYDSSGAAHKCRVLLDSGAMANFMSTRMAELLRLRKESANVPIDGVNGMKTVVKYKVSAKVVSRTTSFETTLEYLIVPRVTGALPAMKIDPKGWHIPESMLLADPKFYEPARVDMLVGAELFFDVLREGKLKLAPNLPLLQESQLGWLVSGPVAETADIGTVKVCHIGALDDPEEQLTELLRRFWTIDELGGDASPKPEDTCELNFLETHRRTNDGRYVVKLPFRENVGELGESREQAMRLRRLHQRSSTDLSLNDVMEIGPTVQDSLFNILLRFRLHKFVFTADVPKMYRQVIVDEAHRKYQRILWRDNAAAAPFLATRAIVQLARDEQKDFPVASKVVEECFYVDDVLTGADSLPEAKELQRDLIALLKRGGFQLHKWCANDESLLEDIPVDAQEQQFNLDDCNASGVVKTLGILWDPVGDEFMYHVQPFNGCSEVPTKQMVLSEMSKLFDPHGLLAPTILIAKLLMQQLWQANVGWKDPIPQEQLRTWNRFRSELSCLNSLRINRRITVDDAVDVELHGYADASKVAYGCSIYLKSFKRDGTTEMQLICGKSRVAPMKELQRNEKQDATPDEQTIPRLELCAALLLAEILEKVRETLAIPIEKVKLWSDSKIVLCWLKRMKPGTPVFVQNRVKKILKLFPAHMWHYISTLHNPADLVSRGVFPAELIHCDGWWFGPVEHAEPWQQNCEAELEPEEHGEPLQVVAAVLPNEPKKQLDPYDVILEQSDYRRLQRVFAHLTRFIFNCRSKQNKVARRTGRLGGRDFGEAQRAMVSVVQQFVYKDEIDCIQKNRAVKGKLRNLNPMYDKDDKLLRVGGRIRNSDLPKDQKHPMILPENNHFTEILIKALHKEHLHVGLNGLLAVIRRRFWPVNAKRTIHRVLKGCVDCFRVNPTDVQQYMGDLPSCRVTASQPFARTGMDYAGPFYVKVGRMRSKVKVYVCLFVCMAIKAVHLELVGSLTTEGFLAALQRFVNRRGTPSELYSDNGTNFRGGNRELSELVELLRSQILQEKEAFGKRT
ncbi:uncharacterized protein LOC128093365 [Culex pipiens pallens]|uniref:uncharacterized protein LOC128093365 n=1 Tax=Culex pipiens pallens TaxID=42434 RepID=UPI0022AA9C33|nr:uncharacterized protein LOC128093365 [Culex pipiens pallens]